MLTQNLARHAVSKELTVYPAMDKWLGEEDKALTKDDFAQHQTVTPHPPLFSPKIDSNNTKVKTDLYTLQSLFPSPPEIRRSSRTTNAGPAYAH